jgi:hypothetical protein
MSKISFSSPRHCPTPCWKFTRKFVPVIIRTLQGAHAYLWIPRSHTCDFVEISVRKTALGIMSGAQRPMPPVPTDPELDHLVEEVVGALELMRRAHYRLAWIAGADARKRTAVLEALSARLECPHLKIGSDLSGRLLDLPPRSRAAASGDQFLDLLLEAHSEILCLDHLEILFDPVLRLYAVDTVQNASRRFLIIAAWPGEISSTDLSFGPPDHPAHVRISLPLDGVPAISLR